MSRVAILAALCIGASAAGAAGTVNPTFAFGRTGGNIAPFRVEIRSDGTVAHSGAVRLGHPGVRLSLQRREALLRIAQRERFWSLPASIRCPGSLPDFASLFVTVRKGTATRTVRLRGSCNRRFARVYGALSSAASVR
jgi:hypothetical protein